MITQNRNPTTSGRYSATSGTAETPRTGRYTAFGRYTDVDTLVRGDDRRIVRPGSYADVDSLVRGDARRIVRTGSYADMMLP